MGEAVRTALMPLISSLEADGYDAVIEQKPGLVVFRIVAGPDAVCRLPEPPIRTRTNDPALASEERLPGAGPGGVSGTPKLSWIE